MYVYAYLCVSRGDVRSGLAEWFSNEVQLTTALSLFLSSDTPLELVCGLFDSLQMCGRVYVVCVQDCLWLEWCFIFPRGSGVCLRCFCVGVESLPSVCGLS